MPLAPSLGADTQVDMILAAIAARIISVDPALLVQQVNIDAWVDYLDCDLPLLQVFRGTTGGEGLRFNCTTITIQYFVENGGFWRDRPGLFWLISNEIKLALAEVSRDPAFSQCGCTELDYFRVSQKVLKFGSRCYPFLDAEWGYKLGC